MKNVTVKLNYLTRGSNSGTPPQDGHAVLLTKETYNYHDTSRRTSRNVMPISFVNLWEQLFILQSVFMLFTCLVRPELNAGWLFNNCNRESSHAVLVLTLLPDTFTGDYSADFGLWPGAGCQISQGQPRGFQLRREPGNQRHFNCYSNNDGCCTMLPAGLIPGALNRDLCTTRIHCSTSHSSFVELLITTASRRACSGSE